MVYYISDFHFGDQTVFDKCHRERLFRSLIDFEEKIIYRWNAIISNDDDVYILGDITGEYYPKAIQIIRKLKGRKHLIIGNHDESMTDLYRQSGIFEDIGENLLLEDSGTKIHVSHYPLMDWIEFNRGGYLIYGHIHNKALPEIKNYYQDKPAYNASCDVTGYVPRTLKELIELKEANENEAFVN